MVTAASADLDHRPAPESSARPATDKRSDIQGLRALAVSLVVIYHLFPDRLRGGFIGVDVFFVISGFLITSHLLARRPRGGRDLLEFWGRRIRRLLPASLTVLLVTLVASRLFEPETRWETTARQTAAAATYVVNWSLARDSVDYLAAHDAPSPVQHFWSLSVEEQFYLGWPLVVLLLGYLALARSRERADWARGVFVGGFGAIVLASFAWSVHFTAVNPSSAYFVTTTRIWELGLGGLVAALVMHRRSIGRSSPVAAAVLAGGGLVLIAWSAFSFSGATPFPGWHAAIPVGGTALVLGVAAGAERWSPGRLLALRPCQWLGDVSYSVYLWHWPLLVLLPAVSGGRLGILDKAAVVVLTLLLAALTKTYIEDAFRTSTWSRRLGLTYATAAIGMAVVVAASMAVVAEVHSREADAKSALLQAERSHDPCFGAGALDPRHRCAPSTSAPVPAPALAADDKSEAYPRSDGDRDCFSYLPGFRTVRCVFGDRHGKRTIVLVGNSHAGQWVPALEQLGRERHWRVVTYLASQCASADVRQQFSTTDQSSACRSWVQKVTARVAAGDPDLVVMANRMSVPVEGLSGAASVNAYRAGYTEVLKSWTARHLPVMILRDTPAPGDGEVPSVPDCLAAHPDSRDACSGPRDSWVPPDPSADAARELGDPQVTVADLNDRICRSSTCDAVVGGVVVYFDGSHLTATYNRTLSPYLAPKIVRAMDGAASPKP